MNSNPAPTSFEIVTLPIGNGWRVRICDGQRMQFVGGFEACASAEEWARTRAHAWLNELKTATERL